MFLVSSSFAMEVSSSSDEYSESMVTIINLKTSKMSEVLEILNNNGVNLKETAFIFDFDETIALSTLIYKDIKFKLIPSPEKVRTYKNVFEAPFKKYSRSLDTKLINILGVEKSYEILDDGVIDLSAELTKNAGFVGVCSGLPLEESKKEILKSVGIDEGKYFYAREGKADVIYDQINKLIEDNLITAIVLLDNSKVNAIDPFLERMYQLYGFADLKRPLKVIGIEYTKFEGMAKTEDIENELELLKKIELEKSSASSQNFYFPNFKSNKIY